MLKNRMLSTTSFLNDEDSFDNEDTISNFKIKKEDFILDFDEKFIYDQSNLKTTKCKVLQQSGEFKENNGLSPFSIKTTLSRNNSFTSSNLSFDYSKPLSPKTHILNIQGDSNSPISKKVIKSTLSPIRIINNSRSLIGKSQLNNNNSNSTLKSIFKESQFDHSDNEFSDNDMSLDYSLSPKINSNIDGAPSTPSPSKLFQTLSFKSPPSNTSNNSNSSTITTSTNNSIKQTIKKQLFSNKRIQDIKTEKTPSKVDIHPSKLILKPILKNKSSLPTSNTSTSTTPSTPSIAFRKSIITTPSLPTTTTTTTTTIPVNKIPTQPRKSITNSTTTTPLKRSIDTSSLTKPLSSTSTINKAMTTSTTPSKKPRMSVAPLSHTTPNKSINPLPSTQQEMAPTTPTNKSTSTVKRQSTVSTPVLNKPTNKRLSTLSNNTNIRKSYIPPPTSSSSYLTDELEERIQQAILAEANGTYTCGSLLQQGSPEKVEQSEWSPVRRKTTLHDVHACTKKNY